MSSFQAKIVLVLSLVVMCSCKSFHILPLNSTERCEVESCFTLDQLAREIKSRSLTLYFLPGKHYLTKWLAFQNAETIKMIGSSSRSEIWLGHTTELILVEVGTLVIENITIATVSYGQLQLPGKVRINECTNVLLKGCNLLRVGLLVTSHSLRIIDCNIGSSSALINTNRLYIVHGEFSGSDFIVSSISGATAVLHVYVEKSTFDIEINISSYGGSLIYITNCEFKEKYDHSRGGVTITEAAEVIISNSTYTNYSGRSLELWDINHLELVNCIFIDNKNALEVGSVNQLYVINSYFFNNVGTVVLVKDTSSLFINDSTFINNSGSVGGGVILDSYNNKLNAFITNCKFIDNESGNYGGAITIQSARTIRIFHTTFTNNTAKFGGALYIYSYFEIVDCNFTENSAFEKWSGAAIFIDSLKEPLRDTSVLRNVVINRNFGSEVVAIFSNMVKLDNAKFINTAKWILLDY